MEQEIFEREIKMCHELSQKNGGCAWGECAKCGVVPLLYKLHKGKLYENIEEVAELRKEVLQ